MVDAGASQRRQWEPEVWGDTVLFPSRTPREEVQDEESDAENKECAAERVDAKIEVRLEERLDGLDLAAATPTGLGAVVRTCSPKATESGLSPGATILSINEQSMEALPVAAIQEHLQEDPLPLTLGVKPLLQLPCAKKMKSRPRDPVTVCTAHCRGSQTAVQMAIAQIGWKELPTETREASVMWLEHSDSTEGLAPVQTVTRLDAFLHMCRKAPFARCMQAWHRESPEQFAFVPATWILPGDSAELEAAMGRDKGTYIGKPSTGTQGRGIVLGKKWSDMADILQKSKALGENSSLEYVVQRYIASPCLLDGLKFDLRIYVVVTSVVPLRAYLFKEGLARFCTVAYQAPKDGNLKEVCMHLTNFAVNKQSKDFQSSKADSYDAGSKRSVSSVFWQIEMVHGRSAKELWDDISELVANTLVALRPQLLEYYVQKQVKPLHPWAPKGIQILGLDILLDSDLTPHLLELNANPSLSVLQPAASDAGNRAESSVGEAEAPEALPVGSGMAVARIVRGATEARPASADDSASKQGKRSTASSADVPKELLAKLTDKLQRLSPDDLGKVDSFLDELLSHERKGASDAPAHRTPSKQPHQSSERHGSAPATVARVPSITSRHRLGSKGQSSAPAGEGVVKSKPKMVQSHLDVEVKKELIAQALLLARPALHSKVVRLRKQWLSAEWSIQDVIPLDDEGDWIKADIPEEQRMEIRTDAPQRTPALEELDLEALATPAAYEYLRVHCELHSIWLRCCGPNQTAVGQGQVMKLLQSRGFVGEEAVFKDKISCQLWLTKTWRLVADGSWGLDFTLFLRVLSMVGELLSASSDTGSSEQTSTEEGEGRGPSMIGGVLAFWHHRKQHGEEEEEEG